MVNCDGCDYSEITYECGECPMNLCNRCAENHRRSKYTNSHELVKIRQEMTGTTIAPTSVTCNVHPELQISLFCSTCSNIYCQNCHPPTHNHKTNPIENCKLDLQKLCTEKLKYLFDKSSSLKSSEIELLKINDKKLQNLGQLKKDLSNRKKMALETLEKEFSSSIIKIQQEENRIKDESAELTKNTKTSADKLAHCETNLISVRNSDNVTSLVSALRYCEVDESKIAQTPSNEMLQTLHVINALESKTEVDDALSSMKQIVAVKVHKQSDKEPSPRLYILRKKRRTDSYGFRLHCERGKTGHFITDIKPGSPTDKSGLQDGDKILEINGKPVTLENHTMVVQMVKSQTNSISLLVLDPEGVQYYENKEVNFPKRNAIFMGVFED